MRQVLSGLVAVMLVTSVAAAQNGGATTADGIYSRTQALRGQDVYAGNCRSCHTPESHAGPLFASKWNGRTLLELYAYIRDQMPKNDPGTLTAEEYVDVMAYMLRMNRLPMGAVDLASDTLALKAVRIDIATSP